MNRTLKIILQKAGISLLVGFCTALGSVAAHDLYRRVGPRRPYLVPVPGGKAVTK